MTKSTTKIVSSPCWLNKEEDKPLSTRRKEGGLLSMPFLIPALVALSSDAVILFLGRGLAAYYDASDKSVGGGSSPGGGADDTASYQDDGSGSSHHWVYRVYYLVGLAVVRILLVMVPLLFHSYTGTALRFQMFYQLLYWGTLVVVLTHMLGLSLVNPESLEALIPLDSASNTDDPDIVHEWRRIWYMLLLSLVSDVCHLVLLMHVRSTAPYHPLLVTGKKPPSIYFTLRSQGISSPLGSFHRSGSQGSSNGGADGEPALMHAMSDFVDEMQARLQRTKADWAVRLEDFTSRLGNHERPMRSISNPLAPLTPFRVLLHLFADEDVIDNGKIDTVFDMDEGSSMTFFVPQLLSFLLHGALYKSQSLEEWILNKCRKNVHFAHRCYWFLRSWCLEAPAEPVMSRPSSETQLSSSSRFSSAAAPFLDEPASPQEVIPCGPRPKRDRSSIRTQRTQEKLLPEERAMIERLMLRVKECGEDAAEVLAYGNSEREVLSPAESSDSLAESHPAPWEPKHWNSPSDLMAAVESGFVPVDPSTGYPSVKHMDSISATSRLGFLPLQDGELQLACKGRYRPEGHGETGEFDKTPQFLDALIFLADSLFHVSPKDRRDELRKQLRQIECELLPSNSIYVPIGNVHHRVWRVVADESVCIGTKERVPCIVCLEVVDYAHKRRKPRAWSFLDRLPRKPATASATPEATEREFVPSPNRRVSVEGIELSDLKSELETVNEWRYARRDPLRRSSIFDKVTSTVRVSMKGPLDKMKEQMLHSYNDRPKGEELRSLTLSESLNGNGVQPKGDNLLGQQSFQEEQFAETTPERTTKKVPPPLKGKDTTLANISRANSGASLVSMGQWTSPQPADRMVIQIRPSRGLDDSECLSLPYGSDHEEELHPVDQSRHAGIENHSQLSSGTASVRRPPVVFRESWQSKQERLRAKSAFGHHPGWRILPLLIKANDDLRQEQLASQLIYRMAAILSREKVPVWLCPYEIIALTESGGIIEAIPDTISLDSLKRNDPHFRGLKYFFLNYFGDGTEEFADAQANFVESLAAYSIVCFLLQLKDRHNGNILLDNRGHIIHIDFGFFFLSSPGKNVGFESAPFKLTRDFVELLGGPNSRLFRTFRELCVKTFLTLRKHCMEIILLVEMLKTGNEELNCFRGRPDEAIRQLRDRFRLDLNDRACREYVNCLVDDSIENWRTDWYDRYQRYFVGVL